MFLKLAENNNQSLNESTNIIYTISQCVKIEVRLFAGE